MQVIPGLFFEKLEVNKPASTMGFYRFNRHAALSVTPDKCLSGAIEAAKASYRRTYKDD